MIKKTLMVKVVGYNGLLVVTFLDFQKAFHTSNTNNVTAKFNTVQICQSNSVCKITHGQKVQLDVCIKNIISPKLSPDSPKIRFQKIGLR